MILTVKQLACDQQKSYGDIDKMVRSGELDYIGNGRCFKRAYTPPPAPKKDIFGWDFV